MSEKNIIPMDRWPVLLPMYMAEHESSPENPLHTLEEIADHFQITVEDIEKFSMQVGFQAEMNACLAEVKNTDSVLRQKAKAQIETYLDNMIPMWMASNDFPPAEKVKLLKQITEWAEVGGSVSEKAKAKLATITETKAPSLNIFISPAGGGVPTLVTGVTVEQTPEEEIVLDSKEKPDVN